MSINSLRENLLEKDFNHFMNCFERAGKNMEDSHYFQIRFVNSNELKFRERVYCYELYHQLRKILGNNFRYKLDGEIDKEGHPIIHSEIGSKKPDLILHKPRNMDRNLVIIEVKPVTVINKIYRLTDDIKTLKNFLDVANYYRAIMLIYGNGQELPKKIYLKVKRSIHNYEKSNQILLIWHPGPCQKPEILKM